MMIGTTVAGNGLAGNHDNSRNRRIADQLRQLMLEPETVFYGHASREAMKDALEVSWYLVNKRVPLIDTDLGPRVARVTIAEYQQRYEQAS